LKFIKIWVKQSSEEVICWDIPNRNIGNFQLSTVIDPMQKKGFAFPQHRLMEVNLAAAEDSFF
jgi:hypothetical protein